MAELGSLFGYRALCIAHERNINDTVLKAQCVQAVFEAPNDIQPW